MKIKNVIFDVDGVLLISTEVGMAALTKAANHYRLPLPNFSFLKKNWGKNLETELLPICKRSLGWREGSVELVLKKFLEISEDTTYHLPEGLVPALEILSKDFTLGIATNRNLESMKKRFEQSGLDFSFFKYFNDIQKHKFTKPDPRIFNFLWEYGCLPEETIFVGDTIAYDLAAARNNFPAIKFVGITSVLHDAEEFENAGVPRNMILDNPSKLPGLLIKSQN